MKLTGGVSADEDYFDIYNYFAFHNHHPRKEELHNIARLLGLELGSAYGSCYTRYRVPEERLAEILKFVEAL